MRPRQIAPVALILGLTVAGFIVARLVAERNVQRDSEHRAEVAAAQIRGRVEQGASLAESLRRFMLNTSGTGVTSDQFARNALRWLSPAGFPAAAWVEQVPDSRRAAYERRLGEPIVGPDQSRRVVPLGSRSSYLAATLVSGFDPLAVPGIDLGGEPGMATALTRATRLDGVAATPVAPPSTGTSGLFLVGPAPNLVGEVLRPGYVVVFVSALTLRAAAKQAPSVQITGAGTRTDAASHAKTASKTFTAAGQRFDVGVPEASVRGAAAVLPWIILGAGLVLAALAAALGINTARRARTKEELDRIFTLSSDLIAVADFDGYFTRVNPAAERILGYTEQELLARPYLDFVHPDDREKTAAEAAALGHGKTTLSFESRYVRNDGSVRVLEWTSTPVVEEGAMYAVARDVTERRQAESEVERLADEQAALRRVATLVAEGAPPMDVLAAVIEEVGRLLQVDRAYMTRLDGDEMVTVLAEWHATGEASPVELPRAFPAGPMSAVMRETRRPVRLEPYPGDPGAAALEVGIRFTVAAPITVKGSLWGFVTVASTGEEPPPPETEARLGGFTELVATAISNTQARDELRRVADEQATLRRVATLIARKAPQAEVFTAIAEEIGQLLGTQEIRMLRYEGGSSALVVGSLGSQDAFPVGSRQQLKGDTAASRVLRTGRTTRIDDYGSARGPLAETARSIGVRSAVGAPILVEGRLWGAIVTGSTQGELLQADTESRLGQFTELMATAIGNTESHARAERLTEEQGALRRVATLVAEAVAPAEIFSPVSREICRLFGADLAAVARFEHDPPANVVVGLAKSVEGITIGSRWELDESMASMQVYRTGRSARVDNVDWSAVSNPIAALARRLGVVSTVSSPIIVEGRLWGAMAVTAEEPLPLHAEERLEKFTALVATAIAKAESREALRELADEQAALRRVATLVAEGALPSAVFAAVAAEMERLLDADGVTLNRYEPDEEVTVVAHRGSDPRRVPAGTRVSHRGENVTSFVRRSEGSARMEHHAGTHGAIAEVARNLGVRASVGAPIVVEGRLWGVAIANWRGEKSPPADTEERMAEFAELLETAIANADSRDQLTASRARLLTEGDEARRRVVRDLHDGAQQRLVHTILTLKLAQRALREEDGQPEALIGEALEHAEQGNAELRELAHGILPSILTRGGLRDGVNSVVRRLDLPVQVDVPDERFPAEIEASAYFIVAEALTNVVKHAQATRAEVRASVEDGTLQIEVRDDGIGGADPESHGLVGVADRAAALRGRLELESPRGGGTVLTARLPLAVK